MVTNKENVAIKSDMRLKSCSTVVLIRNPHFFCLNLYIIQDVNKLSFKNLRAYICMRPNVTENPYTVF